MGAVVNPLAEIETAVKHRAKDISLEMSGDDGLTKLRALVDEEVERWSADYARGLRPFDLADPDAVAERACRNLAGYGPLEPLLADDERVGDHDQRAGQRVREAPRRPERLPRRGPPLIKGNLTALSL